MSHPPDLMISLSPAAPWGWRCSWRGCGDHRGAQARGGVAKARLQDKLLSDGGNGVLVPATDP